MIFFCNNFFLLFCLLFSEICSFSFFSRILGNFIFLFIYLLEELSAHIEFKYFQFTPQCLPLICILLCFFSFFYFLLNSFSCPFFSGWLLHSFFFVNMVKNALYAFQISSFFLILYSVFFSYIVFFFSLFYFAFFSRKTILIF